MNCFNCDSILPEKGYFCPSCATQVKCKGCNEELIKDAKICVSCGEALIIKTSPTNVNTIEFSENEDGRNFKASFTDTVGQSISDSFAMLLGSRISHAKPGQRALNNNITNADVIVEPLADEGAIDNITTKPKDAPSDRLQNIFNDDGTVVTLNETRLKAKTKADYSCRLTLLFLYYKSSKGIAKVSRSEVNAIIESASLYDGNYKSWLANNALVGRLEGNLLELKLGGREQAKKFLEEIYDNDLTDGWIVGTQNKGKRKSNGKSGNDSENIPEDITRTNKKTTKARPKGDGPYAWLKELVEEGFFKTPKSSRNILDELSNRSHNLQTSGITSQMEKLCHNKLLRRQKQTPTGGGKTVFFWSNW